MQTWQSLNPTTGQPLASFTADDADAVRCHVERAREAFPAWRNVPLSRRVRVLKELRRALAASAPDLAHAITLEIGKPLLESLSAEILLTLDGLDTLIRNARKALAPSSVTGGLNAKVMGFRCARIHREPFGVVGILGTWNYPLFLNCIQIASALLAGNTVVWKPSELASFVAARVLEIFRTAGVGEGLLEVVYGGPETGKALAEADCDKYVLTGGINAGRALLGAIAHELKPAVLELSGQDAAVVCADADVDAVARTLAWGAFTNCGQTCVAVRRIYYEKTIEERLVGALVAGTQAIRVGDPLVPDTDVGPLRTSALVERAEQLVRKATAEGAKVLVGGRRLEPRDGNFFAPTLLTGIDETSAFFDEDIFGPITVLCPVADAAEGIDRANRSRYGLGASVWTRNRRKGKRLARDIEAGIVSINSVVTPVGDCRLPFGGFKRSGYGRTHGVSGLREMTTERVVADYRMQPVGRGNSYPYGSVLVKVLERFIALRATLSLKTKLKTLSGLVGAVWSLLRGKRS